jgi:adenylate kinase family enzyme
VLYVSHMKGLEFPIISTKLKGLKKKFNIESPEGRKSYFESKVSDEIGHINKFLEKNTFIAYFLGKKGSGKGTYSKLFTEIFGEKKVAHISIGDIVREVHKELETKKGRKDVEGYLNTNYRGYISVEEGINAILTRSTEKVSVPNELILSLIQREIDKYRGKALFIDGFPRTLDQVSYSLFFRDLMGYREDPDFFILIDIPEAVIEERIKYRRACPKCQTSRNLRLLITSKVEYDTKSNEFYLVCDNPNCEGARMVAKEGDDKGLKAIRDRLDKDEELIKTAFKLYGFPKILLRNHVPVGKVDKFFDEYEITPTYEFNLDKKSKVKIKEKPWIVKDDDGVKVYSLLAPAVVVSMLKQTVEVLGL